MNLRKKCCIVHTPKISTSYFIFFSPAMLVATQTYWPRSVSVESKISSFFPLDSMRRFSLAFTGTPSFNQVRRGGGLPAALHSNVNELPATTCLFWIVSESPSITGGTGEGKSILQVINFAARKHINSKWVRSSPPTLALHRVMSHIISCEKFYARTGQNKRTIKIS